MKPRSIISLIIAAVLVFGGIITCAVAESMAKSDGVMLFPEGDSDGNLVYKADLDGITKINVNTEDADISVIGGAERSSIEVINFNANYYKLTFANGSLNFSQVDDFLSMFKFWENGFSFKGMRYLLRFGDDAFGSKRIVVRLSPDDHVALVNLSSGTGAVSVEDCSYSAAYTLSAEHGAVGIKNVTGASSVYADNCSVFGADNVSAEKLIISSENMDADISNFKSAGTSVTVTDGSFDAKDCEFGSSFVLSAGGASTSLSGCSFTEGVVSAGAGNVTLNIADISTVSANVSTKTGKVSVNGTYTDSFARNTPGPQMRIDVTTDGGDVVITYPE